MRFWGELEGLRPQRVGEVSAYTNHACSFRICGNETQLGLQIVEKLATLLVWLGLHRRSKILYPNHFLTLDPKSIRGTASFARLDFQTLVGLKVERLLRRSKSFFSQPVLKIGP